MLLITVKDRLSKVGKVIRTNQEKEVVRIKRVQTMVKISLHSNWVHLNKATTMCNLKLTDRHGSRQGLTRRGGW